MSTIQYGALTPTDIDVLEACMAEVCHDKPTLWVCEIGVYQGQTARGMRDWCAANGKNIAYWGVEDGSICNPEAPFEMARLVLGKSHLVADSVPDNMDLVIVDADHGGPQVIMDVMAYAPKVRKGGMMFFHDTAPQVQQTMPERGHPDREADLAACGDSTLYRFVHTNSVNLALELIHWPFHGWELWREAHDPESKFGGVRVYRRI